MNDGEQFDLSARLAQLMLVVLIGCFLFLTLYGIKELSIPITVAFLVTLMLNPFVDFLEGTGLPRIAATLIVFSVFVAALYAGVSILVPLIQDQVKSIADEWPEIHKRGNAFLAQGSALLTAKLPSFVKIEKIRIDQLLTMGAAEVKAVVESLKSHLGQVVTHLIITPIITIIFLLQGDDIFRALIRIVPNRYFEMSLLIVHRVKQQITGYIRGLAIQLLINVAIFAVGFKLIGLNYGFTMGVIAGSLNFIPYIGPVIGIIPALAIGVMQGSEVTLLVLVVFSLAHLFDNVFTQPVILARSAELHPLLAILGLITCQQLFGVVGMIIAIPLVGILLVTIEVMHHSLRSFRII
jgi:predicted PurR-regulated permease PerM